jgi:exosortase E/protease (VPEID-CTERM system)
MTSRTKVRNSDWLPYVRWVCLIALLAAEILSISYRFDAKGVHPDRPWYALVVNLGSVSRLGLAVVLATALVAGPRWWNELKREAWRLEGSRWIWPAAIGNPISFLAFYWLSVPVLEGRGPVHPADWALVAAWGFAGIATLVFWAMAMLPAGLWVVLLSKTAGRLLAGSALGAAAYLVGGLAELQWQPLAAATLQLVRGILSLGFPETVCEPDLALVGTREYKVKIAPACSGYEGMGLIAALVSIALWMFRRDFRFPRALALLPLAMALMWLANAVRIAALVVLGTWGYRELALAGFHSLAGWVLFLLIGLGLIAWARQIPFFSTLPADTPTACPALDGAYLIPLMALIATAMVTGTLSPGFDRYYPARIIAVALALVIHRRSYSELRATWSWEAVVIGCGVFVLWLAMEPRGASQSAGTPMRLGLESLAPSWAASWLFFRVVGSSVAVPIAEELAFRGYLTRRLVAHDFQSIPPGRMPWWSFLISSLLFGALHGRFIAGTLAGMAYALAYHRRGELTDSILAHGVTNALIAITVLTTGYWSLWG